MFVTPPFVTLRSMMGAVLVVASLFAGAYGSTVTYSNVDQVRNPAGPASVPDFSLPNQILLPTPAYGAQDDDVSPIDVGESSFNFTFDADVDPGRTATTVGLRQRLGFEINDPDLVLDNFVRAEAEATIAYTRVNGVAVDPTDPANQQVFTLGVTLQNGDVLPGNLIETLVPLDVPATSFEVTLDNTLTAFSVSGTALITSADLQFITLTEQAVPEPSTLAVMLLGVGSLACVRRR